MRIALLLSSLVLSACTVGEVGTTSSNNNGGTDAGSGSGSGSGSNMGTDPNACVDRLADPDAATVHTAPVDKANPSNAGQNCIQAQCHINNALGAGASGFQFAGTVYKAGTTQPNPGVAVRIVSGGMTYSTYTDAAGNFHFNAGTLSGTFTATTNVSACPTVTPMITQLAGGNGGGAGANSCNLCHTTGAGAQAVPINL